jgi:type IV pilus biogenesis protein CpaD/CtpE
MTARFILLVALGLTLAGCTQYGAWNSPGMWQPTGSNEHNLQAMVADPEDLASGRSSSTAPGDQAAHAVANLESGKSSSLGSSGASYGSSSGSGGAGGSSSAGGIP